MRKEGFEPSCPEGGILSPGSGEGTVTETAFCKRVATKGFWKQRTRSGIEYFWIGIRSDQEQV